MSTISIQTKKMSELTLKTDCSSTDTLIIRDEYGVKTIGVAELMRHGIADGAGAHNSVYRGEYLGSLVSDAQYEEINSGRFRGMCIGDYWVINNKDYVIAAFDYYWDCGEPCCTTHHVVLVPRKQLYTAPMNTTDTTQGGYANSAMRTTNLEQAKTIIKNAFNGHVLSHRILITNAMTNGYASGVMWVDSEVDLMNEQMVYGNGIFSPVSTGTTIPSCSTVEKNQLPLFAMNSHELNNGEYYWLRDFVNANFFINMNPAGTTQYNCAQASIGVRPFFCIH